MLKALAQRGDATIVPAVSALAKTAPPETWPAMIEVFDALGDASVGLALLIAFGCAIICALGAILAYAAEMLMAGTGIRDELAHGHRRHLLHFPMGSHNDT